MPTVTTLRVDPAAGEQQSSVRTVRNSSGDGYTQTEVTSFTPQGIVLDRLDLTGSEHGLSLSESLTADGTAMLIPTTAAPGNSYSFSLSGGQDDWTANTQVQDFEDVQVGSSAVRTLRLQTSIDYSGQISGTSAITSWVDREGLVVREHVVDDLHAGLLAHQDDYISTLESTTPS